MAVAPGGRPEWGSDVVVDVLRLLGVDYAAVLPGSTFRGIHDSAVNHAGNTRPELILCNQEMIAVSIARGYARVTGRPMVAIVHNLVGLLQASMNIYDAWCDRVPVIVLGGTGPMDAASRRPWIDWIHTANVQGNVVRDYTKWDDQPASVAAIPESLLRAHRIAVSDPPAPVYVCFDAALQEQAVDAGFVLPDVTRYRAPAPSRPDDEILDRVATTLVGAEHPVVLADRVGRDAGAFRCLVELAELLALPVIDRGLFWHNFPTPHALDFHGAEADLLAEADVVLGLDVVDLAGAMLAVTSGGHADDRLPGEGKVVIHVSTDELLARGLATDYQRLAPVDVPVLASPAATLPLVLQRCRGAVDDLDARTRVDQRRRRLEPLQTELRRRQRANVEAQWERPEISELRLLAEVWAVIKDEDFVITTAQVRRMAPGVCDLPGPERFLGAAAGGAAVGSGLGVATGAALALRGTGKLPVAVLGDGEVLASVQALWTLAHYRLPTLLVVANNRTYYNDEAHQERIARVRARPPENKWIAMRMEDPAIDFGGVARHFGVHGEGPVRDASELPQVLHRAVDVVRGGGPALVDVWVENRAHG